MDTLVIAVDKRPEAVVVTLEGSASAGAIDALALKLNFVLAGKPRLLIFDFSKLQFMASLAMGQLVAAQRSVAMHHGVTAIASCPENIRGALAHARLTVLFQMTDSVEQALTLAAPVPAAGQAS